MLAVTVAKLLVNYVFTQFSLLESIVSDRGKNFVSQFMTIIAKRL